MPQWLTVPHQVVDVFLSVDTAITRGELIHRDSSRDKEFHFQDWFGARLASAGILFDQGGRNSYPDFTLVNSPEGFEVKGLGYPGREADYDCNSQVPVGTHNGRDVYYVFGRYPSNAIEPEYPVIDLVVCHGSLLNADSDYVHLNKSIRAFGTYGDILLRDRKMYVAPTPFALLEGTTGQRTLILPAGTASDDRLTPAGEFERVEVNELLATYTFDLTQNDLIPGFMPNPNGGMQHLFEAFRIRNTEGPQVNLRAAIAPAPSIEPDIEPEGDI